MRKAAVRDGSCTLSVYAQDAAGGHTLLQEYLLVVVIVIVVVITVVVLIMVVILVLVLIVIVTVLQQIAELVNGSLSLLCVVVCRVSARSFFRNTVGSCTTCRSEVGDILLKEDSQTQTSS